MLKIGLLFKKNKTLRVNNSRIPTIQNAKFSGQYFYVNQNIQENFQNCISTFKKIAYFMGKLLQNHEQLECEIFRILLRHVNIIYHCLFNLHDCTFKKTKVQQKTFLKNGFYSVEKTKKNNFNKSNVISEKVYSQLAINCSLEKVSPQNDNGKLT